MKKNRKKTESREWLGYAPYLAPMAYLLLSVISLYIPCMRFTTPDEGTGSVVSAAGLLNNAWLQVREFLFGGGELSSINELFSWIVLGTILACVILFLVGAAAIIWSSVGALRYLADKRADGAKRALYVTLFPNRIAVGIWHALILPLLAFPRILVLYYERVLYYSVILNLTFIEPIVIGAVLYLLTVALCFAARKRELASGISPYRVKRKSAVEDERDDEAEESTLFAAKRGLDSEAVSEVERRAREEQAERIRELLSRRDGGNNHSADSNE